jgi:Flp pilus assembly protein TadG
MTMRNPTRKTVARRRLRRDDGQILIMYALALPLLILFTAAAVDMGLIYITKAKLSKAVDAACLTGVKNYPHGIATANELGTYIFNANFGSNPPTPAFTWDTGSSTTPVKLTVSATARVDTYFMRYLPQFKTWNLTGSAQATRSNLVMSLVLDRSDSMRLDKGRDALLDAVPRFIDNFSNGIDHVALVSFASNAGVNVPLTTNFSTPMKNAVAALKFNGGTFGTGAGSNTFDIAHGPPLSLADYQNNTIVVPQEVKVVVYFTDGQMNTIQDTFNCPNLGSKIYNYGGYDSGTPDFFDPTVDDYPANGYSAYYAGSTPGGDDSGKGCPKQSQGDGRGLCNKNPPYNSTASCKGVRNFFSQKQGHTVAFASHQADIVAEAEYRAMYTAGRMWRETPTATFIYTIGLGTAVNADFLENLANDEKGSAFNPSLPIGLYVAAPGCNPGGSTTLCTQQVNQAFQAIAAKILLRLTQ